MKSTIPDEVRFLIMDDPSINIIRPDNHGFDGPVRHVRPDSRRRDAGRRNGGYSDCRVIGILKVFRMTRRALVRSGCRQDVSDVLYEDDVMILGMIDVGQQFTVR